MLWKDDRMSATPGYFSLRFKFHVDSDSVSDSSLNSVGLRKPSTTATVLNQQIPQRRTFIYITARFILPGFFCDLETHMRRKNRKRLLYYTTPRKNVCACVNLTCNSIANLMRICSERFRRLKMAVERSDFIVRLYSQISSAKINMSF